MAGESDPKTVNRVNRQYYTTLFPLCKENVATFSKFTNRLQSLLAADVGPERLEVGHAGANGSDRHSGHSHGGKNAGKFHRNPPVSKNTR